MRNIGEHYYIVKFNCKSLSPETVYQITVHDEVVAEISTPPKIKPGVAAAGLLALRKRFGSKKYRTKPVSENIKGYLYVAEGDE